MVTGGDFSMTTEIKTRQDKNWKVLPNGNLPIQMWGFRLMTIHNEVFSFGKELISEFSIFYHFLNYYFQVVVMVIVMTLRVTLYLQSLNSIWIKGAGTISPIT